MPKLTPLGLLFVCLTITFTVVGQLLVKKGMIEVGEGPLHVSMLARFAWKTFTNPYVILGLGSAVVAAVCWTVAVSRSALSVAYPFMALAIVLVLALSGALFGEIVPLNRWMGVAIVCVGLIVAAGH